MELSKDKIKNLQVIDLYKFLLPIIDKIYLDYKFIKMKKGEYKQLVFKVIKESKESFNDEIPFSKYVLKNLTNKINELIKRKLNDDSLNFLDSFINFTSIDISDYNSALKELERICNFLEILEFTPSEQLITSLLKKNKKLNKILKLVANKYNLNSKNLNSNMDLFIQTYIMLNEEEFLEDLENESKILKDSYYENDSFKMYLREISQTKMLTAEEERNLFYLVLEGDKEARDKLITCNLRLVVSIARRYQNRGLSLNDLVQEGNIGLMKAVSLFDVTKGFKFSTYAIWWIRQGIQRAIYDKGREIRIPIHVHDKLNQYRSVKESLQIELSREPTEEELAKKLGVSVDRIVEFENILHVPVSLDSVVGDSKDTEFSYFIPSNEEPVDLQIQTKVLNEDLGKVLKLLLNSKELEVLTLRYGLNGQEPKTLEEVGKIYNLTRERIRQIEARAFLKIKRSQLGKSLANVDRDIPFNQREIRDKLNSFLKPNFSIYELLRQVKKYLTKKEYHVFTFRYDFLQKKVRNYEEISQMSNLSTFEIRKIDINIINKLKDTQVLKELTLYDEKIASKISIFDSDTKKEESKCKEEDNMPKKLQSIFDYLSQYKRENILKAIERLNERDKNIIYLRYGSDLDNPKTSLEWNSKHSTYFYSTLIPRIKRILDTMQLDEEEKSKETKEEITKPQELVEITHDESSNKTSQEFNENQEETKEVRVIEEVLTNDTKDFYINNLNLLKTPILRNLIKKMSAQEEIIIRLILGEVKNKYFEIPEIANFFGISENEVIEIIKKVFNLYKNDLNRFLDNVIRLTTTSELIISESEYIEVIELLRTEAFIKFLKNFTPFETIIICLKLTHGENSIFSSQKIADFYNIKVQEVEEIIKKVLNSYKNNCNQTIDDVLSVMINQKVKTI